MNTLKREQGFKPNGHGTEGRQRVSEERIERCLEMADRLNVVSLNKAEQVPTAEDFNASCLARRRSHDGWEPEPFEGGADRRDDERRLPHVGAGCSTVNVGARRCR
jgi:hypothetical protein